VVVREEVQSNKAAVGRKLIDLPGNVFRVFVTSRSDSALEIWRDWGRLLATKTAVQQSLTVAYTNFSEVRFAK
jgi:hypothetical protein